MNKKITPLTCTTLTAHEAVRTPDWSDLRKQALSTVRSGSGVTMTFAITKSREVESFAAQESECCGFLSISTSRFGETIQLEIDSDDPAATQFIDRLTDAQEDS